MTFRSALAALLVVAATPAAARPLTPSPEVRALREEIAALLYRWASHRLARS